METLHPGNYLIEEPVATPIEGVATATAGIVGVAGKGEIGKGILVTSWKDYQTKCGDYLNDSYLSYAVRGFFENGGTRLYVSRVVHFDAGIKTSTPATFEISDGGSVVGIFDASTDGTHGNGIEVEVTAGKTAGTLNVSVFNPQFVEKVENVNVGDFEDVVNSMLSTIKFTAVAETAVPVGRYTLAGGTDGLEGLTSDDYVKALEALKPYGVKLIAVPGMTDAITVKALESFADANRAQAIFSNPLGIEDDVNAVVDYYNDTVNLASSRDAVYNTWVTVSDPIGVGSAPTKNVPADGHIMGIYARTDRERGVWKAPAGLQAQLRGVLDVVHNINDDEHDLLNPENINAIRSFEGEGIVLWGARTRGEHKYISTRRLMDYVGDSVIAGTRWAVFEPNDQVLWNKVKLTGEAFLRGLWTAGGLRGESESDAFFFECNANTTSQADIDAGRLFANIGIADQKPAEFIIFRLSLLK